MPVTARSPALRRIVLLTLALLVPTVAFADPKDDARRHFVEGLESAKARQYEVALQHFLAAQEAYPHPSTLYNIARTYQDLDDLTNALSYYKLFADAAPDKAGDVTPVIAVIEARLQQERTPVVAPVAPAPTPTTSGSAVAPEVLERLQALSTEVRAKLDEVDALTAAIAEGSVLVPTEGAPVEGTQVEGTPVEGAVVVAPPPPDLPDLPAVDLIEDAYTRIVVTASRYGQEPIDSPSAVTVLTEEDIRLSGATSVPDLLRQVVGVDAMSLASGQTDLSIRGFNREINNKVLILLDGRSTYVDFLGTTLWNTLTVSLDEIERIEIIRGPGSAVYGANAVTGVVNIITRTPGDGKNEVRVDAGTTGYASGNALLSGRRDRTSWRASVGYDRAGRWAKEVDPNTESMDFPVANQDLGQQALHATGRIDRTFGKESFASVSGGFVDGVSEFYNLGALGDFYLDQRSTWLRGDAASGPVHVRAFWNSLNGEAGAWAEPKDWIRTLGSTVDSDVIDVEAEANGKVDTGAIHHRLNAGIGYRYKRTDMPGFITDVVSEHHGSAFVQDEATIDKIKLVASLRADQHPLLPLSETLSPRGAIIARVAPHTSLRATGGTAFRAPNHIESYMAWTLPTDTDVAYVRDYGSTTLRPERIVTGEVGLHDESTSYHTADLTLYANRLTDIVYLSSLDAPSVADLAYNAEEGGFLAGTTGWVNVPDQYLGYGIEAEAELFPTDGLDVYANVDLQRIDVTSPGQSPVRDKSTSAAKINGGFTYRTPFDIDFALHGSWSSAQVWRLRTFDDAGALTTVEQPIDGRIVWNAKLVARPIPGEDVEVGVGAWNLGAFLGDAFKEHPKGQPVGPRVYGTLSYRF